MLWDVTSNRVGVKISGTGSLKEWASGREPRTPMAGCTLRMVTWTGPVPGARPAIALNCAICWFCVCAASHARFFSACAHGDSA